LPSTGRFQGEFQSPIRPLAKVGRGRGPATLCAA
jgi:hypothetical protein